MSNENTEHNSSVPQFNTRTVQNLIKFTKDNQPIHNDLFSSAINLINNGDLSKALNNLQNNSEKNLKGKKIYCYYDDQQQLQATTIRNNIPQDKRWEFSLNSYSNGNGDLYSLSTKSSKKTKGSFKSVGPVLVLQPNQNGSLSIMDGTYCESSQHIPEGGAARLQSGPDLADGIALQSESKKPRGNENHKSTITKEKNLMHAGVTLHSLFSKALGNNSTISKGMRAMLYIIISKTLEAIKIKPVGDCRLENALAVIDNDRNFKVQLFDCGYEGFENISTSVTLGGLMNANKGKDVNCSRKCMPPGPKNDVKKWPLERLDYYHFLSATKSNVPEDTFSNEFNDGLDNTLQKLNNKDDIGNNKKMGDIIDVFQKLLINLSIEDQAAQDLKDTNLLKNVALEEYKNYVSCCCFRANESKINEFTKCINQAKTPENLVTILKKRIGCCSFLHSRSLASLNAVQKAAPATGKDNNSSTEFNN